MFRPIETDPNMELENVPAVLEVEVRALSSSALRWARAEGMNTNMHSLDFQLRPKAFYMQGAIRAARRRQWTNVAMETTPCRRKVGHIFPLTLCMW